MFRTIQSPGVELREIDLSIRPASLEGTSVFLAGFANQGPVDEILQPTSLSDFEQIYGYPTNSAEQYFYQTAKALFNNSPAKLVTTRLPYGFGKGEGFFHWRYSALVYPARAFKGQSAIQEQAFAQSITLRVEGEESQWGAVDPTASHPLSGLVVGIASTLPDEASYQLVFSIDGAPALTGAIASDFTTTYIPKVINVERSETLNQPSEIGTLISNFITSDPDLSSRFNFDFTAGTDNRVLIFSVTNIDSGVTSQPTQWAGMANQNISEVSIQQGADEVDIPGTGGEPVNSFDEGTSYFFGQPTYIELTQDEYTALLTQNFDWEDRPGNAGVTAPFEFSNIGSAGLIVLNKAQVTNSSEYEGYYVSVIDNNNYNPATPFNGVGSVYGVQGNTQQSLGTKNYTLVPSTRLSFPLSANKLGDGTSISEIMENLNNFDLGTSDYDDTITLGLFKLRKSIYTPDTIDLDYVLTESFVGSLDYHRKVADQTGGPAKTFFIGDLASNSNYVQLMVNPHISNEFGRTWVGTNGKPSKKVRFLSDQLATPFSSPGNFDSATSYSTRVGAPSGQVIVFKDILGSTDSLFPVGVYQDTVNLTKNVGQLVLKLERAMDLVENADIFPLNLAVEAGLGTIYINAVALTDRYETVNFLSAGPYIDSKSLPYLSAFYRTNAFLDNPGNDDSFSPDLGTIGQNIRANYNAVANVFISMAEKRRKDFMVILDPLRQIFVQGQNAKIISTKRLYGPNAGVGDNPYAPGFSPTNFSQHIYWPLRHQFGSINSSYAAIYANWAQVIDGQSNKQVWVPFSGFAAAAMANSDQNFNPWAAPAGFTRGVITGVNDLAVYPRQNQRDQLYKAAFNPVTFFPGEGFVIFGQKTTLKKPSAFDRINVRRLFLYLETITKNTLKYFVFEPNTLFTRTQVINTLSPIFDNARNTEGIYDYIIVCDERNNTPDVIDNNELKVDIYIKPVRTAEFILVTFYATRTGQNFQELVGR